MNQRKADRFIPTETQTIKPQTIARFNDVRLIERISRVCHDKCQDLKCIQHCAQSYMHYRKAAQKDIDLLTKFK